MENTDLPENTQAQAALIGRLIAEFVPPTPYTDERRSGCCVGCGSYLETRPASEARHHERLHANERKVLRRLQQPNLLLRYADRERLKSASPADDAPLIDRVRFALGVIHAHYSRSVRNWHLLDSKPANLRNPHPRWLDYVSGYLAQDLPDERIPRHVWLLLRQAMPLRACPGLEHDQWQGPARNLTYSLCGRGTK